jgi:hypothetical protein
VYALIPFIVSKAVEVEALCRLQLLFGGKSLRLLPKEEGGDGLCI